MKGYASWKLFPEYPTLKHYVEVLLDSPEFFVMFWNSVKITVGALAGGLLVGMPAAWGFAKFDFPGKNILFTLYIALMMMPFQVMLLGNYLVLDKIGLLDSLLGIIFPAVFSTFPIFIMYRFFKGIPLAFLEAARLDGAGELKLFFYSCHPLGLTWRHFCHCSGLSGILESDRTADGIFVKQKNCGRCLCTCLILS